MGIILTFRVTASLLDRERFTGANLQVYSLLERVRVAREMDNTQTFCGKMCSLL